GLVAVVADVAVEDHHDRVGLVDGVGDQPVGRGLVAALGGREAGAGERSGCGQGRGDLRRGVERWDQVEAAAHGARRGAGELVAGRAWVRAVRRGAGRRAVEVLSREPLDAEACTRLEGVDGAVDDVGEYRPAVAGETIVGIVVERHRTRLIEDPNDVGGRELSRWGQAQTGLGHGALRRGLARHVAVVDGGGLGDALLLQGPNRTARTINRADLEARRVDAA